MEKYHKLFLANPKKPKETQGQYYDRLIKKAGFPVSRRTLQRHNPEKEVNKLKFSVQKPSDEALKNIEKFNTGYYSTIPFNVEDYKITVYPDNPKYNLDKNILDSLASGKPTWNTMLTKEGIKVKNMAWSKTNGKIAPYEPGLHVILPDAHIPFENVELMSSFVNFLEDNKTKIKGFNIIGDFLDMLALSRHNTNMVPPKGYSLGIEYERGNQWLDMFDEALDSDCDKSYLYGNHEDFHARYFKEVNNSVLQDVTPNPTQALKLKERGYVVKENWKEDYIQLGKLQLIHGFFLGVNPCRTHLTRMKSSVMFGHSHRISSYYEGDQAAFNIGTMCDIESPGFSYASRYEKMNWKNGFGLVYLNPDGTFQAEAVHCQDNHFWFNGKQY